MNLSKWCGRVANWKKTGSAQRPIEWHIAHLHSEVSEVFEAFRDIQNGEVGGFNYDPEDPPFDPFSRIEWKNKEGHEHPEGFGIELADVILVALYIAAVTGVDIEQMMEIKMHSNEKKRARS
jgi:NTP pyrophosphatase (non-canonical NTP hydrolase)